MLALALNIWATLVIVSDHMLSYKQRAVQIIFVWLLPLLGAILAIQIRARPEKSTPNSNQIENEPDDFGPLRRLEKSSGNSLEDKPISDTIDTSD